MHAVHVGIGRDNDFAIAQAVEAVLDVERGLEEVKFLVLINDFLREPVGVERFALQREDRLRLHIAAGGERTGGAVALDDEEAGALGALVLVAEVEAAVAEFLIVQRGFLRALAGEVADAGEFLALVFARLDFSQDGLGGDRVFVEINVERLLDELADEVLHARAAGAHIGRAELRLGLRLEDRLLHAHGDRRDDGLAHVGRLEVLLEKIPHGFDDRLAERLLVRAAHRGVLAVDEREILFAVMTAVRHRELDVVTLEVDDRVKRLAGQILCEQVLKTFLGFKRLAVERERQTTVQERVVPEHVFDEFRAELEVRAEERLVGDELDQRAVTLGGLDDFVVLLEFALSEFHQLRLAVAHGHGAVFERERVDRLLADAVQTDGFLEGLAVVFRARVDDRDAVDEFAQRDAAAVIAHAHGAVIEFDFDLFALPHHELVDGIIDRLLEQNINAVLGVHAVAEPADIHAGTQADMLERGQGLDAGFGVVGRHGRILKRAPSVRATLCVTREKPRSAPPPAREQESTFRPARSASV